MNKINLILISALFIILTFCKEETPIENNKAYSFSGKVYSLVDSQKVYLENVKVYFREDSTLTDSLGTFLFEDIPVGNYQLRFLYSSPDSIITTTTEITINNSDLCEEFLLYQNQTQVDQFNLIGRVYSIVNEQKEYLENVIVTLGNISVKTDNFGDFTFYNLISGEYEIKFEYSSEDTNVVKIDSLKIIDKDLNEEFLLYKIEKDVNADLFPLAVGNKWVYNVKNISMYGVEELSIEFREVTGTTIVDNQTFFVVSVNNPIQNYSRIENYRIDPVSGLLYNGSLILTNLSINEGDFQIKNANGQIIKYGNVSKTTGNIFGETRELVNHKLDNGEVDIGYTFVKNVGIVNQSTSYLSSVKLDLVGAKVDGVEFGELSPSLLDINIFFYPLSVGKKWVYQYKKYYENGNTTRSTLLRREVIVKEVMSNGKTYFKIENKFDDRFNAYYEWQRIDTSNAKLYGYDNETNTEYLIEDYSRTEAGYEYSESYMPSILPYDCSEFLPTYTNAEKYYNGYVSNQPVFTLIYYYFKINVGITRIKVEFNYSPNKIIEEIKLIG